jgi:predicted glutamine amidotransferase
VCRLFGILSLDPIQSSYYLNDAPQSLLHQSNVDEKRKQGDGWGIGWFEGKRPQIFKSPQPIFSDLERVQSAVKKSKGNVLLGHVRWASNPLKLPRHELIGMTHTQPFSQGPWLFVHNGTLFIPREVKAELGSWAKYVKGKNDSEVLFYWLLKTVIHGSQKSYAARLKASFRQLDKIWQGCKNRYPIYRYPYHGLNWVLTNGQELLSFCYVDPRGFDKGKALCHSGQPYYQLQVKMTDRNVILASESLDQTPGWKPLEHGRLLVAKKTGRRLAVKVLKGM